MFIKVGDKSYEIPLTTEGISISFQTTEKGNGASGTQQAEPRLFQQLAQTYAKQLAELNQRGFHHPRRNLLIALKKHNGDVEQACEWLKKTSPTNQKPIGPVHVPGLLRGQNFQQVAEEYSSQLKELNQKGFHQQRRNLFALKKFQGDVPAAAEWLEKSFSHEKLKEESKPNSPVRSYSKGLRGENIRYSTALQELQQKGFTDPKQNFIALKKHNGNADAACAWLRMKTSKPEEQDLQAQLKILHDQGYFNDRKNRRLLCRANGNLETVLTVLSQLNGTINRN